jgi:hypothetical protein
MLSPTAGRPGAIASIGEGPGVDKIENLRAGLAVRHRRSSMPRVDTSHIFRMIDKYFFRMKGTPPCPIPARA